VKIVLIIALMFVTSSVSAHSPLDYKTMKPREEASNVKTSVANISTVPCGPGVNAQPGVVRHRLKPGDDFEVTWIETIDHPAKYLIDITSQDVNNDPLNVATPSNVVVMNDDDFFNDAAIPQNMANKQDKTQNPRVTSVNNPNPNAIYKKTIKIPNDISCDKCTLRLMQKMFDGGTLSTRIYTHCTDISIKAAGQPTNIPEKPTGFKISK
jgi:hypothetical protein